MSSGLERVAPAEGAMPKDDQRPPSNGGGNGGLPPRPVAPPNRVVTWRESLVNPHSIIQQIKKRGGSQPGDPGKRGADKGPQ